MGLQNLWYGFKSCLPCQNRGDALLKYIVELVEPQYIEVNANSEEQAIQIVKNSIQDPRVRDYVSVRVVKEIAVNENK